MVPHLVRSLRPDMLVLWDRNFFVFHLIGAIARTGARLLARVKTRQLVFQRRQTLADGSYLSTIYPSFTDR
jgi:hypothetical protein